MSVLWKELVHGGGMWSHVLKRGTALRITDIDGGANAGVLLYNSGNPVERYNMADTLKAQHIARLTAGNVLYSDMGRILCSVVADSLGWHDPLGGCGNASLVARKYGHASYQERQNACYKNGKDCFLTELGKYALGPRDLIPNINFFSKIAVAGDGSMHFAAPHSKPGDFVELRAEMNTLVILQTCPHPLDPNSVYEPKPVELSVRTAAPAGPDDACRNFCPENGRGFTLTERYFL